jgi:hypothetical protein
MPLFVSRSVPAGACACVHVCVRAREFAVHRRRVMEAMLRSRGASLILTQRQSLADGPSKILRARRLMDPEYRGYPIH